MRELSTLSGDMVTLAEPGAPVARKTRLPGNRILASRPLPGIDGKPVALLLAQDSPMSLNRFERLGIRVLLWLSLFAFLTPLILGVALKNWVLRPLRALSKSLQMENLAPLRVVEGNKGELGVMARLIRTFFEQRKGLLEELQNRRQHEHELIDHEIKHRQSEKMDAVSRFAGGMAHEFNNLLTAIIGYADLLISRDPAGPQPREIGDQILKAGRQAALLTRQLLAFSRRQAFYPKVLNLNQFIAGLEHRMSRIAGNEVEFRLRLEAQQSDVRLDPVHMEDAIMSLVLNARESMPDRGVLCVQTRDTVIPETAFHNGVTLEAGRYVTLVVSDTGCGISPDVRPRIFEPFFTTKDPRKSPGLGLAMVLGIVRQNGGAITVDSEPGTGTSFLIHLPLETEEAGLTEPLPRPTLEMRRHETVLVAEDDDTVRELVCSALKAEGYHVLCAADGAEARKIAESVDQSIGILVTDTIMPGLNGPDLVRAIRSRHPEMKVLFVSGSADDGLGDLPFSDLEFNVLAKPFTPREVAAQVDDLVKGAPTVSL